MLFGKKKELVFARTTPQHKVMIVEHFQKRGEVVAVTGDGVNDSIALKRADIGVAMGLRGSDVAKEASKIVLLDDNFASIVNGIEHGRVLFDNLKKTIAYTVSHSVPNLVPIVMTLTAGVPLGLAPLLVVTVDLGTELAPAISLAYEKAEADVMARPPRNSKRDRLVSASLLTYSYLQIGLIEAICSVCAYFAVFWIWFTSLGFGSSSQSWIFSSHYNSKLCL
jgi:ATPase, P-type (transporting), HAD superfamily, subfamily IC